MRVFINLPMAHKLACSILLSLAVTIGVLWYAKDGFDRLAAETRFLIDRSAANESLIRQFSGALDAAIIGEQDFLLEADAAQLGPLAEEFRGHLLQSEHLLATMIDKTPRAERKAALRSIGTDLADYRRINEAVIAAVLTSDRAGAAKLSLVQSRPLRLAIEKKVAALTAAYTAELEAGKQAAQKIAEHLFLMLMAVGSAGAVLSCLLLAYIGLFLTARPMRRMSQSMERLAAGDYEVAVTGGERRDEVGSLARSLGIFKERLLENRRLQDERRALRQQTETERRTTLATVAASFEASVSGVAQLVLDSTADMQTAAQSMSQEAGHAHRQTISMASALQQASANVQTVAAAAEELSASISEIGRQVEHSTQIADRAVANAARTDKSMQALSEAARTIGDVVKLITAIAGQTNLLALNATIEAARAGDAGKGFAVVASEVKNLANQTAKATEDIGQQIGRVQAAAQEAVAAIATIGHTIRELSGIASQIAASVDEQGRATDQIVRNIAEAATGTEQVSGSVGVVTRAVTNTGEKAEELLRSAASLGEQSGRLKTELEQFVGTVLAA